LNLKIRKIDIITVIKKVPEETYIRNKGFPVLIKTKNLDKREIRNKADITMLRV
jgi:hypothetical protein